MEAGNVFISSLVVLCVPQLRRFVFEKSKHHADDSHQSTQRVLFFDFAKGISIIAVVLIHVIWVMDLSHLFISSFLPNFLNACLRFAIPVFFIASGSLLTLKDNSIQSIRSFFGTKFLRIVVPYFLMVGIVLMWKEESFSHFFSYIISGNILPPFYFVVILVQLYFLFPILNVFRFTSWLLPVSFGISLLGFFFRDFWFLGSMPFFPQYLFFFVYGITKGKDCMRGKVMFDSEDKMVVRNSLFLIGLYFFLFFLLPDYYYNIEPMFGVAMLWLLFYGFHILQSFHFVHRVIWVGKMSLWIFLVHFPLVVVSIRFFYSHFNDQIMVLVLSSLSSLLLSLVFGSLLKGFYAGVISPVQMKKSI